MPAAAKLAATSSGSAPRGKVGAFQPCGSPRKNWAVCAPAACAAASGSSSWRWAPMRTMLPSLMGPQVKKAASETGRRRSAEAAVRHAQAQADERGDDASHDEHALLSRGGVH